MLLNTLTDAREAFLTSHSESIIDFWNRVKSHVVPWRDSYVWPPGCAPKAALDKRAELQRMIQNNLREQQGSLTKATFDSIMTWGFGLASICSEVDIRKATRRAFSYLEEGCPACAARVLVGLPGIGISRASKVLSLSDQDELGIYDSRSAHGLSDLCDAAGRPIIAIPPGRVIRGHMKTPNGFCVAFQEYTWVLQYLRDLAVTGKLFGGERVRVADLEMAFFARSRTGAIPLLTAPAAPPTHLRRVATHDEESLFETLGPGKKAKQFRVIFKDTSITVLTGKDGRTLLELDQEQMARCLRHFRHAWFPLSNSKTAGDRDPNGLGEYFSRNFGSSVFASHFAALWVHQGLLQQENRSGAIWLKAVPDGQERLH